MRIFAAVMVLTLAVAACGSNQVTPGPVGPTGTPIPSAASNVPPAVIASGVPEGQSSPPPSAAAPAPSASPDAAAAGKAYLAAAGKINKAVKALDRKYPTFKTVAQARTYYRKAAKLERAFTDAVRKIQFPPDMASDVKSLLAKDASLQSLYIEAGNARSWTEFDSVSSAITKTGRSASAAANLVRQDLGLPSVPF